MTAPHPGIQFIRVANHARALVALSHALDQQRLVGLGTAIPDTVQHSDALRDLVDEWRRARDGLAQALELAEQTQAERPREAREEGALTGPDDPSGLELPVRGVTSIRSWPPA